MFDGLRCRTQNSDREERVLKHDLCQLRAPDHYAPIAQLSRQSDGRDKLTARVETDDGNWQRM